MKTTELKDAALDWVVAKVRGVRLLDPHKNMWELSWTLLGDDSGNYYDPSSNWEHGGPIIDRFLDNLFKHNNPDKTAPPVWCAVRHVPAEGYTKMVTADGPTPLIAAMRCYVLSELGSDVEVPKELMT